MHQRGWGILAGSRKVIHKGWRKIDLDKETLERCNRAFLLRDQDHETDLSAFCCAPQAHPRFSGAHAHPWRPRRHSCAPRQRPSTPRRLSANLEAGSTAMAGRSGQVFCFGALDRLHRPAEFAAVMSSRTRICGGCFELRYKLHQHSGEGPVAGGARLGLIVPKRLAKRAVLRNLIKRLAREAFRNVSGTLPPADLVLRLAKPPLPVGQRVGSEQRCSWRRSIDELLAGLAAR